MQQWLFQSALYKNAIENNIKLPDSYDGYSFHSYDTLPLPTKYLTPAEVLEYRDNCYHDYHKNPKFLNRIEKRYGSRAKKILRKCHK